MKFNQESNKVQKASYSFTSNFAVVPSTEEVSSAPNHLQLAKEIRANFELLDELSLRKQFLLKDIQGIVKRV